MTNCFDTTEMYIDLGKFFQPAYLFNSRPPFDLGEIIFYGSFFALILIATFVLKRIFGKKAEKITPYNFFRQKYFSSFLTCIIIGFVLLFFRWQMIPYFSLGILLVLILLLILILIILFLFDLWKKLPRELEKFYQALDYQKYLPKPKKLNKEKS